MDDYTAVQDLEPRLLLSSAFKRGDALIIYGDGKAPNTITVARTPDGDHVLVTINGGAQGATQTVPSGGQRFGVRVPLKPNAENVLSLGAADTNGRTAQINDLRVAQISLTDIVRATVFVTLEPCPMCAGALVNARVGRVVFGASDPKAGAVRTLYQLCEDPRLNHRVEVTSGVLADECSQLLRDFFARQRKLGKK